MGRSDASCATMTRHPHLHLHREARPGDVPDTAGGADRPIEEQVPEALGAPAGRSTRF